MPLVSSTMSSIRGRHETAVDDIERNAVVFKMSEISASYGRTEGIGILTGTSPMQVTNIYQSGGSVTCTISYSEDFACKRPLGAQPLQYLPCLAPPRYQPSLRSKTPQVRNSQWPVQSPEGDPADIAHLHGATWGQQSPFSLLSNHL